LKERKYRVTKSNSNKPNLPKISQLDSIFIIARKNKNDPHKTQTIQTNKKSQLDSICHHFMKIKNNEIKKSQNPKCPLPIFL
jgi:hypothetical protein